MIARRHVSYSDVEKGGHICHFESLVGEVQAALLEVLIPSDTSLETCD